MHAAVGTLGPMYPLHTQGGWDFTGLSAHFEYMLNIPNTLRRVSRFLSDYPPAPGCGFCVVMEDLDELTEGHSNYDPEFAINVENLISNIFGNLDEAADAAAEGSSSKKKFKPLSLVKNTVGSVAKALGKKAHSEVKKKRKTN